MSPFGNVSLSTLHQSLLPSVRNSHYEQWSTAELEAQLSVNQERLRLVRWGGRFAGFGGTFALERFLFR